MNSSAFRWLILIIPVAWVILRLVPAEHPKYRHLQIAAPQAQEQPSHREADIFMIHDSLFKAHYQSHYAASGFNYDHYRLAYKYGFDLALDPDNQKLGWKTVETQARQNWNEGHMGLWSQHDQAIVYGWEQGVKLNGG